MGSGDASAPDAARFGRTLTRWRMLFVAAELAYLLALAVFESRGLRPLLEGTWVAGHPLSYGCVMALAGAAGYAATRGLFRLAYGRLGGRRLAAIRTGLRPPPRDLIDGRNALSIPRSVAAAVVVALSVWAAPRPVSLVVAAALAAVLWLAEALFEAEVAREAGVACAALDVDADARLAPLRQLAADRHAGPVVLLTREAPDADEALWASCLPSPAEPMFYLSARMIGELSPEELKAVFAHELAHHELRHSRKSQWALTASRAASLLVLCLAATAGRATWSAWQAVRLTPVLLVGWYVLRVLAVPVEKAYLRHQERAAHRRAVAMTGEADAYVSAMRKVAADNLAEAAPGALERWLFWSSPSLAEVEAIAHPPAGRGQPPFP